MSTLCSFLIPSRGRPDGLHRSIRSIISYSKTPINIEFVIWFDDDDSVSVTRSEEFQAYSNTHIITGKRAPVYEIVSHLLTMVTGQWVCMFNDDAYFMGQDWDKAVMSFPTRGVILQPEMYQLNESEYRHATRTGFPFFPNKIWNEPGFGGFIHRPNDHELCDMAERSGWKIDFIKGLTIVHDRKVDRTLPKL